MSIPCKQILVAILLGMFAFTMQLAADEPDDLRKLILRTPPANVSSATQWRYMFRFNYQYGNFGNVYGSEADFDALRALNKAADQKFEAALGPTIDAYDFEYVPTEEDIEIARYKNAIVIEELFDEFGRITFLRAIQFQNMLYLRDIVRQRNFNDPSFLTIPEFREKMNLTAEQRTELGKINANYEETVNERLSKLYVDICKVNLKKLSRIKSELSPKQRDLVEKLIGSPLNWARLISMSEEREIRKRISERSRENMEAGKYLVILPDGCDDLVQGDFRRLKLRADYDEHDLKWPHFDSLLTTLLSSEFSAEAMEMSNDQRAELNEFIAEVRETSIISAKFANERLESLLDGSAEFQAELEGILVPLQLTWLRQVELQFFTAEHRRTFGITAPVMVQRFELSSGTVGKILEIAAEFEEPINEMVSLARTELAKIGFEFGQKRVEVLEPKDRERFQLLTGVDCDRLAELMEDVVQSARTKHKHSLN